MEFYRLYRTNRLVVNRKYQRKLVWTKAEKEALIDSVISQYPIPLILLAEVKLEEDGPTVFEIIDGMQRLNALFSFIENQTSLNGKFFDVSSHPLANTLSTEGIFKPIDREGTQFIDPATGASFLEYQLPVSTFQGTERNINEVFGRINSNGKHLSPQEVRQAGSTGIFSNLVRELGAEIRGDVSRDILPFTEMPEISIETRVTPMGYGVSAEETFWCKHGILRTTQLRDSEDEQLIADFVLSIALKEPFASSKENFDLYYGKGDNDKKRQEIESAIIAYGAENLKHDIKLVFDTIHTTVTAISEERFFLKSILNPNAGSNPVKEPFYTLYMAWFHLMVNEGKVPHDFAQIISSIDNLASKITSGSHHIVSENRVRNINSTIGLIQTYFIDSKSPIRSTGTLALDFENYLRRSKVEAPFYDFKQGFYTLNSGVRRFDEEAFEKVMHNIAALANLGRGKKGYLFIGVTDREEHTIRVEELDRIKVPRVGDFGVPGLEREAIIRNVSLDQYVTFITEKISASKLPATLKANVTSSIIPINYKNHTVLMVEVVCGERPTWYNENEMYIRDGSNCKRLTGGQIDTVYSRF